MRHSPRQTGRWSSVAVLASITTLVALTACSDATTATPREPPSITFFRTPCGIADVAVVAVIGNTNTMSFRVRRRGGFSGVVDLSIEGLPAGMTARFDPASLPTGVESTELILTAASDAEPVFADVTVWARGDGVASVACILEIGIVTGIPPI